MQFAPQMIRGGKETKKKKKSKRGKRSLRHSRTEEMGTPSLWRQQRRFPCESEAFRIGVIGGKELSSGIERR